jgi:GT2 family glycosyltransferase
MRTPTRQRPGSAAERRAGFVPTPIVEVELNEPLSYLRRSGPVRLLVRRDGFPVLFAQIEVPRGGLDPDELGSAISTASRRAGADTEVVPRSEPDRRRPSLSVVVTTCGASAELLRTIDSIRNQSIRPRQIILVDNRPATSGVAAMYAEHRLDDVQLIPVEAPGLSRARNAGLAAATGEIVAFTDDDVVVDRRWAEAMVDAFVDDRVACVTGLVLPWELETPAQGLFEQFGGFGKGFQRRRFDLVDDRDPNPLYPYAAGVFGTGANSAFRTTVLDQVGGFDVCLGTGSPARGGEDLDIHLTLIQRGHSIVYEPAALIRHRHHAEFGDLRRQIFNYGAGLSAMLVKRWTSSRQERRELNARITNGFRYLVDADSPKNARKTTFYPRSLTVAEFLGVLYGPIAYGLSRWSRSAS